MRVQLELYASLMRYLPPGAERHAVRVDMPEGATAHALMERCGVPRAEAHLVMRNGVYLHPDERDALALAEGDVIGVWPPVAGG